MATVQLFTGLAGDIQEAMDRRKLGGAGAINSYDIKNCSALRRAKGFLGCQYGPECLDCENYKRNSGGSR